MPEIFSKWIVTVIAMAVVVAASNAAQAHRARWHHHWHRAENPAYLPYSYEYYPIYGYSRYGNCYLVEQFVPYRPYLARVCPLR